MRLGAYREKYRLQVANGGEMCKHFVKLLHTVSQKLIKRLNSRRLWVCECVRVRAMVIGVFINLRAIVGRPVARGVGYPH